MKIFFLSLTLSVLFVSYTQAQNLPIRVPTKAMDYTKFGMTLSGNEQQDLPRMRGLLARHIANCYVRSASLSNGMQSAQDTLNEGCEIEAYNKANILIFLHSMKSGIELSHDELNAKKHEFWKDSSPIILSTARKIAHKRLGL